MKNSESSDNYQQNLQAFELAVRNEQIDKIQELVASGFDVNAIISIDYTALHVAAIHGKIKSIEALVKYGAKIDVINSRICTPLHEAASNNNVEAVSKLVELGAEVDVKNIAGQTPLHYAASRGSAGAIKVLVSHKAKIDAQDNNNNTPLHLTVNWSKIKATIELLEHGAKIDIKNKYGDTPLSSAKKSRYVDLVELLKYAKFVDDIFTKKDLTPDNISKILPDSVDSVFLPEIIGNISSNQKKCLGERITNSIGNFNFASVKEVQQKIVDNMRNIDVYNQNIATIEDQYKDIDLSFLKNPKNNLNSLVYSRDNPDGYVHEGGIFTLFNLVVAKIAETNNISELVKLESNMIYNRAMKFSQLPEISQLFPVHNNIEEIAESLAGATSQDVD